MPKQHQNMLFANLVMLDLAEFNAYTDVYDRQCRLPSVPGKLLVRVLRGPRWRNLPGSSGGKSKRKLTECGHRLLCAGNSFLQPILHHYELLEYLNNRGFSSQHKFWSFYLGNSADYDWGDLGHCSLLRLLPFNFEKAVREPQSLLGVVRQTPYLGIQDWRNCS